MTTHRTVLAGAEELIVYAIRAVRAAHGEAFEIGYDAADRTLAADQLPDDDEPIRWSATATFPTGLGLRDVTGSALCDPRLPGASHHRAIAWAVTRMLESAGVGGRINLLDAHPGDEPPR